LFPLILLFSLFLPIALASLGKDNNEPGFFDAIASDGLHNPADFCALLRTAFLDACKLFAWILTGQFRVTASLQCPQGYSVC
jgi:hypothetical protein